MLHQGNRGNNIVKEQTKSRMAEILYHVII